MRIGIVCEGPSDMAVIVNILKGVTGLDTNNFVPLVPVLDNTSKAHLNPDTFSSWSVVVAECQQKRKIERFFKQTDSAYLVVHLDTAEAESYGVEIPDIGDTDYCSKLRERVVNKIDEWLAGEYRDVTLYAIAIQEIDSWVITIYEQTDNCHIKDAKKVLQKIIKARKEKYSEGYEYYMAYSYDFRNSNKTMKRGYLDYNCSLKLFWEEVREKIGSLESS